MAMDIYPEIKRFLTFESTDDFYYLQILQRKKENPQLGSNSRVIKNYYIGSIEYLEKHYQEIIDLCVMFNARAMLRLNKRSYQKVALKTIQNATNSLVNGEHSFIRKSYDRACGNGHNDKSKKWIVDIDEKNEDLVDKAREIIENSQPHHLVLARLETKNGVHLITLPFDSRKLKETYPDIDIHKDNPINLYIP